MAAVQLDRQALEGAYKFGTHINPRVLIEEGKAHNKRIYCCFLDFWKSFNIMLCAWLMQRLESFGIPIDMQRGIYELYK